MCNTETSKVISRTDPMIPYGGGGGNNELPKKKDNEDELSFARRCHQMAKAMHAPRYRLRRG